MWHTGSPWHYLGSQAVLDQSSRLQEEKKICKVVGTTSSGDFNSSSLTTSLPT